MSDSWRKQGMEEKRESRRVWLLLGIVLSAFVPSIAVVGKYLGAVGVAVYLLVAVPALFIGYRRLLPWFLARVTERQAVWLMAATLVALLAAFLVVYPLASSGEYGPGSDNDDALNVASMEMLHGRYPYYVRTYLGFPITPMPGALLLALPFVLLGTSGYQNFFWLLAFWAALRWRLKDGRLALALLWVMLALAPTLGHQMMIGSDYIANSLFVLLFIWLVVAWVPRPDLAGWRKALAAVLLGIGLSSRPNFALLLPLVLSLLVQRSGWKSALTYTGLACLVCAGLTLPFYLYDPQGFSPLHVSSKLGRFESVLPESGLVIPALAGILALVLAHPRLNSTLLALFRNCALVQAFSVVSGMVLATIQAGRANLNFLHFGMFFLFFGAAGAWLALCEGTVGHLTCAITDQAGTVVGS